MDTRKKIVSFDEVISIAGKRDVRWVTGHFDPLLAEHARRLKALAIPDHLLVVVITNPVGPLLPLRARGELVAALSNVDYVVLKDGLAPSDDPEDARIASDFVAQVVRRNQVTAL